MTFITITCPHCGYSRTTGPAGIPPGSVSVACPRCRQRFSMAHAVMRPEPPTPSQKASPDDKTPRTLSFAFTGKASEYFGIWIVNILLKIVTFGIYSAWAKVRKRRYFFGSTLLDGSPFGYLADPLALFKGWLIGAALFGLYMVGTKVEPSLGFLFVLVFFAVTPWLIVRSRMFNNRNTEHRGVRFSFRPNYREAYLVFAGLPLLMPFTLGFLFPYMVFRQKKFLVENSSYGENPCSFTATAEEFYRLFIKGLGVFILILGLFFVGVFAVAFSFLGGTTFSSLAGHQVSLASLQKSAGIAAAILMFLLIPLYLTFAVYLETALANLTWNATRIGNNSFNSTLSVAAIVWIRLSSVLAIFFSLGLMIPWASIRMARYRFAHLEFVAVDDLSAFRAAPGEEIGPAGEEIGDIFGIDVAL